MPSESHALASVATDEDLNALQAQIPKPLRELLPRFSGDVDVCHTFENSRGSRTWASGLRTSHLAVGLFDEVRSRRPPNVKTVSQTPVASRLIMNREKKTLLALRVVAVLEISAVVAVFVPFAWMSRMQSPMMADPITEYLARSLSLFYVMNGAMLFFATLDPTRYRPLIRFWAMLMVAAGVALIGIDVAADLPAFWILSEGPFAIVFGAIVLWLLSSDSATSSIAAGETSE